MAARTTPTQFLVMVDFMERHGDLNKPAEGPYGRLTQQRSWVDLAEVLNMDHTGESKPVEKWKKVWSDLKNNTKKKAAKIHRAGSGTGGGPPSKLQLSDLELRILSVTGSRAATGLTNIQEVGAPPARPVPEPIRSPTPPTETTSPVPDVVYVETSPPPAQVSSPPPAQVSSPPPAQVSSPPPTSATRRRDFRQRSASRRSAPRVDAATRHFQANEERWRHIVRAIATEHLQLRRDELQLRREQLQVQSQWQELFGRCIDIAQNIFLNKDQNK